MKVTETTKKKIEIELTDCELAHLAAADDILDKICYLILADTNAECDLNDGVSHIENIQSSLDLICRYL